MEKKDWEKDFEVLFGDIERKDYIKVFIQDLFEQELGKARGDEYGILKETGLEGESIVKEFSMDEVAKALGVNVKELKIKKD